MADTIWELVRERANELVKGSPQQDMPFWALVGLLEGFGNDLARWHPDPTVTETLRAVGDLVLEGLDYYEKQRSEQ